MPKSRFELSKQKHSHNMCCFETFWKPRSESACQSSSTIHDASSELFLLPDTQSRCHGAAPPCATILSTVCWARNAGATVASRMTKRYLSCMNNSSYFKWFVHNSMSTYCSMHFGLRAMRRPFASPYGMCNHMGISKGFMSWNALKPPKMTYCTVSSWISFSRTKNTTLWPMDSVRCQHGRIPSALGRRNKLS